MAPAVTFCFSSAETHKEEAVNAEVEKIKELVEKHEKHVEVRNQCVSGIRSSLLDGKEYVGLVQIDISLVQALFQYIVNCYDITLLQILVI